MPTTSNARPCSPPRSRDRKSTRLNSSHSQISYAVFCLKKKKKTYIHSSHTLICPTNCDIANTFLTCTYSQYIALYNTVCGALCSTDDTNKVIMYRTSST